MKIKKCIKESFVVIGKEGSTSDGPRFIQKLWADANGHFSKVEALAVPGYEYIRAEVESENTFSEVPNHIAANGLALAERIICFSPLGTDENC